MDFLSHFKRSNLNFSSKTSQNRMLRYILKANRLNINFNYCKKFNFALFAIFSAFFILLKVCYNFLCAQDCSRQSADSGSGAVENQAQQEGHHCQVLQQISQRHRRPLLEKSQRNHQNHQQRNLAQPGGSCFRLLSVLGHPLFEHI